MKKKIKNILWYVLTIFFGISTIIGFTETFIGGLGMLLITLLCCPFIRRLVGEYFPNKKIKYIVYTGIIIIGSMLVSNSTPTTSTETIQKDTKPLVVETQKDEKDKDEKDNNAIDNASSDDTEKENIKIENIKIENVNKESYKNIKSVKIPTYSGKEYVVINDNVPFFRKDEMTKKSFELYSNLDSLGRCGVAYANINKNIMPTGNRESIGMIKPTGWHTVKYNNISGKYLYNRCHLIGFQLAGENANEKNLITGTRSMNVDGMLPFENMVADYVKETNHHVLYRVTPVYTGKNLLANGVLMEAKSVEDNGKGILFNVFVYNAQPGISINYATGDSKIGKSVNKPSSISTNSKKPSHSSSNTNNKPTSTKPSKPSEPSKPVANGVWIASSGKGTKYHSNPNCSRMKNPIKISVSEAKNRGYTPCKKCC